MADALGALSSAIEGIPGFGEVSTAFGAVAPEIIKTKDPFYEEVNGEQKRRKAPANVSEAQRALWKKVIKRAWYHDRNFCNCLPIDLGLGIIPIVTILPLIGPWICYTMHAELIKYAADAGCPKKTLAKMGGNVTFDFLISICPVLGSIFSWMNACSTKNAALFDTFMRNQSTVHEERTQEATQVQDVFQQDHQRRMQAARNGPTVGSSSNGPVGNTGVSGSNGAKTGVSGANGPTGKVGISNGATKGQAIGSNGGYGPNRRANGGPIESNGGQTGSYGVPTGSNGQSQTINGRGSGKPGAYAGNLPNPYQSRDQRTQNPGNPYQPPGLPQKSGNSGPRQSSPGAGLPNPYQSQQTPGNPYQPQQTQGNPRQRGQQNPVNPYQPQQTQGTPHQRGQQTPVNPYQSRSQTQFHPQSSPYHQNSYQNQYNQQNAYRPTTLEEAQAQDLAMRTRQIPSTRGETVGQTLTQEERDFQTALARSQAQDTRQDDLETALARSRQLTQEDQDLQRALEISRQDH